MKQLLLMRHAKSSWAEGGMPDFERPLNKRGKRVAPKMASFLTEQQSTPEMIISSPAARAAATANLVSETIGGAEPVPIRFEPQFYHAPAKEYLKAMATADIATISRLMFVGHNPGLEDLVESLTGNWEILSTAAVVQLQFEADCWKEISPDFECQMLNIWRPKEIGID
jgi:phosphohistidine phosphatase